MERVFTNVFSGAGFFYCCSALHHSITRVWPTKKYFNTVYMYDIQLSIPCRHRNEDAEITTKHEIECKDDHEAMRWCDMFIDALLNDSRKPPNFAVNIASNDYVKKIDDNVITFTHNNKVILTCKKRGKL